LVFAEGEIPKAFSESILVLILKAEQGQFRGIALLEIPYKVISSIINTRLTKIELHDALHGSVKGRGMGTAIMEAKLLSQLRYWIDEPLYMVFIDLKKPSIPLTEREPCAYWSCMEWGLTCAGSFDPCGKGT